MYGSWDIERDRDIFCHSGPFLPSYPPMDPENLNFQKNGKNTEDIIILQT